MAIIALLICTAVFAQQKGSFTDPRDGKKYKTVTIGKQTWMAENLNYNKNGSKCYENKPANCARYGRLYGGDVDCPKGWHLPNDKEWETLVKFAGGKETAAEKLKAKSGWADGENGTDDFGFAALPGGHGSSHGGFDDAGYYGNWWSESGCTAGTPDEGNDESSCGTQNRTNYLYISVYSFYESSIDMREMDRGNGRFPVKTYLYSARCVKNQ